MVRSACPLFGIRRSSAIRKEKMYCVYGNSSWYIHDGLLFGGGPLSGGSVIGGSTVKPMHGVRTGKYTESVRCNDGKIADSVRT